MGLIKNIAQKGNYHSPCPEDQILVSYETQVGSSKLSSLPKFDRVQDFMPAQIICKFHKDYMF